MKILMTMNVPLTRAYGGANRSNRALLEGLAARGHTVVAVAPALASPSSVTYEQWRAEQEAKGVSLRSGPHADRMTLNGVELIAVRDQRWMRGELLEAIQALGPDRVLVASEDPSQTLLAAALEACPDRVVYMALTPQLFPFGPESLYPGKERAELVRRCVRVACLSGITARYIEQHLDVPAFIYHPPHFGRGPFPDLHDFRNGSVLLMNPCAVKGVSIFLGLARALPHVPFAAVPGYATTAEDRRALAELPNVALWRNEDNLDDLLRKTRVLLMPTLWMESFGLAAVDAMLRGIPVLASDHGSLPEAKLGTDYLLPVRPITRYRDELGDNLLPVPVVPEQDIGPWKKALEELLGDAALYERQSAAARAASSRFVEGLSMEPFERMLLEARPAAAPAPAPARAEPASRAELTPEQKALLILRMRRNAAEQKGAARPASTIPPAPREGPLPLSFAQQRIVFLDQLRPGGSVYNCPSALRLEGRLELDALARALRALVRRHEVLRTTFSTGPSGPTATLHPELALDVPLVDLSSVPAAERELRLRERLEEDARRPFDLRSGPLLRASVLRLAPEEHVLALNLHHIATDGWSTGVLIRELAALYAAAVEGRSEALPPQPLQYVDYAAWQRRTLTAEVLRERAGYWKAALAEAPAVIELPFDRPRPPVQSHRGASLPFRIPAALTARLKSLAREQDSTLFMLLLSAYGVLLHRVGKQDEVVIGTPVANRDLPETENIVGFFVNTLPLRLRLSGNPEFSALLGRVRGTCLDAFAHQNLPFESLVEALAPARSSSHSPLFQVMFALQNAPGGELKLPGLRVQPLAAHSGTSKFDLNLEVTEAGGELDCSLEYDTALFNPETAQALVTAWRALLSGLAERPRQRIGDYPLMAPAEQAAALAALNPPRLPLPEGASVISLFQAQAARTPHAPAVYFEGRQATYAELERASNQLAHMLIEAGIRTDSAVGLFMERSLELVTAILGILKAGGAYVPLDPSHPPERLDYMLGQTGIRVVLSQRSLAGRLERDGLRVLTLDAEGGPPYRSAPERAPEVSLPHASLAYVMYTSGSTGRPKGVQLPHGALLNLILWHLDKLPGPARTLQFASPGFDASFHEIFATLAAGGCLHVLTEAGRRDLKALSRYLREHRIQKAILPVVVIHHLAEEYVGHGVEGLELQHVISTGEALKITPAVAELFRRLPSASLHNDYGPTETHVATSVRVSDRADLGAPFPSVGRPIRSSAAYVLDAYLHPLPPGLPGELYLAGECLARGYHARPELTADRFVPDPFAPSPGERMYRTGDLARVARDGNIECIGRIDEQVKIRGLRVEPGEVETALRTLPGLDDLLVMCREDAPGDKRLVAYLVTGGRPAPDVPSLRRHLAKTLPEYMIPSAFVALERFPLTTNGKVDRRALPAPERERPDLAEAPRSPRTDIESKLVALWSEVLGQQGIGIRDNFFALGGHSMLMIQVASRIHATFGVELPVQRFFDGPTIEQQAVVVTELIAARDGQTSLDALIDQVDQLDEAEVQRLLEGGGEAPAAVGATPATPSSARAEAVKRALLAAAGKGMPAPITALGVPSSNRPELLATCLQSYLGNFREHGRRLDVVVSSNPRDGEMDRAYREVLAKLQASYGQRCWYAGPAEKEDFVAELARGGYAPPDVARFALFDAEDAGKPYGINRNALLVHLSGTAFLTADDDTRAELLQPVEPRDGLAVRASQGASEIRVVTEPGEAERLSRPLQADLVGLHEGVLGGSVADVMARLGADAPLALDETELSRLPGLEQGAGRVVATYHGWAGDSGWASPRDALFLTGESWQWLTRSEEAYQRALRSWELARYAPRLTLNRSGEMFNLCCGLDGRQDLPPFFPVQRREDVLFGLLTVRGFGDGYLAHLPSMVRHGANQPRFVQGQETVDVAMLVEACLEPFAAPSSAESPAARLERMGRHLEELGQLAPGDFAERMRAELRRHLSAELDALQARVDACPAPRAFWARDMGQMIELSRRALKQEDFFLPRGLMAGRGPEKAQVLAQRLLTRYGRLLRAWPQLLAGARALRERGITLARPIAP